MLTTPLCEYLVMRHPKVTFAAILTSCWRGYIGTWQIVDNHLYLVKLDGEYEDGSLATLEDVFPGHTGPVLASWYSGTLRVPRGDLLHYVHMGWASTWEMDLLIEVDKGEVLSRRVVRTAPRARAV